VPDSPVCDTLPLGESIGIKLPTGRYRIGLACVGLLLTLSAVVGSVRADQDDPNPANPPSAQSIANTLQVEVDSLFAAFQACSGVDVIALSGRPSLAPFDAFALGQFDEAVVRMGGELPPDTEPGMEAEAALSAGQPPAIVLPEPTVPFEQTATAFESLVAAGAEDAPAPESPDGSSAGADKKHRRRGRRGGRNRRKAAPPQTTGESRTSASTSTRHSERSRVAPAPPGPEADEILPPRVVDSRAIPRIPMEQVPESGSPGVQGRFGDPGLASRLSLLEMQLRRLLT